MKVLPESRLGKWSVGMNIIFMLLIAGFFVFMFLGFVTFDDGHWWDVTVGIAVLVEIIAFTTSIMAIIRNDRSVLVYISFGIGVCVILFGLLHSLFIPD